MKKLIGLGAGAAALAFLFQPGRGPVRRGRLKGHVSKLASLGRAGAANDATLTQRVRSEIFRDAAAAKGKVNVNAQDGVIQLRGEVESEHLIGDLADKARSVQGVRDVENLLHTPGQPAPMHQ